MGAVKELPRKPSHASKASSSGMRCPTTFKANWVDYIEGEFDRREYGHWFVNNGKFPRMLRAPTICICSGRASTLGTLTSVRPIRIFFIFWEACKADSRSFGMTYLKIRRSGFSFMGSSECVNTGTLAKDSRVGILSKTGSDAKKMFTDKVVPIANRLPFFFKPIQDGMDKPKTELAFPYPCFEDYKEEYVRCGGRKRFSDWTPPSTGRIPTTTLTTERSSSC